MHLSFLSDIINIKFIQNKSILRGRMMEGNAIKQLLNEETYSYLNDKDKDFIRVFTDAINDLGYLCNSKIVDGICYGRHMMIFRKANVKSDKVYARLYFRDSGVVLRFFFSNVNEHAGYIEKCPDYVQDAFIGNRGVVIIAAVMSASLEKVTGLPESSMKNAMALPLNFLNLQLKDYSLI